MDHLILRAADLETGATELEERLGVSSLEGGRHTGLGTHNAIVPLGSAYLEILAVCDPDEAADNPFGRWALARPSEHLTVDAVVLRTDDLDSICRRNGLEPVSMSRIRPDGIELSWRLAGLEDGLQAGLPAFIEWRVDDHLLPGAAAVVHSAGEVALRSVEITGDVARLQGWIGNADAVSISPGAIGFSAVFDTPNGQAAL